MSVVLLLGAGLLMRSFLNIQRVDRGFDSQGVLTMRLTLPRERYPGDAAGAFFDRLSERLAALPGVRAVSAASQFPPIGDARHAVQARTRPGATVRRCRRRSSRSRRPATSRRCACRCARAAILSADRSPRHAARRDGQSGVRGSISRRQPIRSVNGLRSAARIGRGRWTTIVGVVADYRNSGMTQPVRPEIYIPVRQQTAWNQLFMLIRTDGSPASAAARPRARRSRRSIPSSRSI